MRIVCLQHSERVRPLDVERWAAARAEVQLDVFRVDEVDVLPDPADVDRLIVLGGEMNTDDVEPHPWLDAEREFIAQVLDRRVSRVFGICLGSQLLAEVLGGSVGRADDPEIGWHRMQLTPAGRGSSVFGSLDPEFDAFEWHGNSWTLPPGATLTVRGACCSNQAFEWDDRAFAVQFHPEFTYERTCELAATTTEDLTRGGGVQRPERFLDQERFAHLPLLLDRMLDAAMLVRSVSAAAR